MAIEQSEKILANDITTEFSNCVGYGVSSKKISEFTSGTPISADRIFFEQSNVGKSATVENLGKAIGINMDLLWDNANPSNAFEPQVIDINVSSYKLLLVMFTGTTSNPYLHEFVTSTAETSFFRVLSIVDYSTLKIMIRAIIVLSDGRIQVKEGYISNEYGTYTRSDAVLLPFRIYGVR